MTYPLIKTLHLLFDIAWMAAVFYLPRILVNIAEAGSQPTVQARLQLMGRRLYKFITRATLVQRAAGGVAAGRDLSGDCQAVLTLCWGSTGTTITHQGGVGRALPAVLYSLEKRRPVPALRREDQLWYSRYHWTNFATPSSIDVLGA